MWEEEREDNSIWQADMLAVMEQSEECDIEFLPLCETGWRGRQIWNMQTYFKAEHVMSVIHRETVHRPSNVTILALPPLSIHSWTILAGAKGSWSPVISAMTHVSLPCIKKPSHLFFGHRGIIALFICLNKLPVHLVLCGQWLLQLQSKENVHHKNLWVWST